MNNENFYYNNEMLAPIYQSQVNFVQGMFTH